MLEQRIGRYQIKESIGTGGMATVYKAYDDRFNRDVAIKMLNEPYTYHEDLMARFKREAQLVASLEHHAIVPVYDFGEFDMQPYMVMRLMPGGSLRDRLDNGPLALHVIAGILNRICAALDKAHANGVIHRDLKPANILFDNDGVAHLADFGIARLVETTHTGTIIGSPNYMSPEQARGLTLDWRTDIYQIGVVLFEMLTGGLPFKAETPDAILYQHVHEPPPLLDSLVPELPASMQELMDYALAKDPNDRIPSAGELSSRFLTIVETLPGFQTPIPASGVTPLPSSSASQAFAAVSPSDAASSPGIEVDTEQEVVTTPVPLSSGMASLTGQDTEVMEEPSVLPRWLWTNGTLVAIAAVLFFVFVGYGVVSWLDGEQEPEQELILLDVEETTTEIAVTVVSTVTPAADEAVALVEPTPSPTLRPSPTPLGDGPLLPASLAILGGGTGTLAFMADQNGNFDIYALLEDGTLDQLTTYERDDLHPVWSPDGSRIVYQSFRGNWDVFVMDANGGNKRNLTDSRGSEDSYPRWSPDGGKIVFNSNREGDVYHIFIMDADGSNLTQLTSGSRNSYAPSFAPDGEKIVYESDDGIGVRQLYVMNPDGSDQQQITFTQSYSSRFPVWSPDGQKIAFYSARNGVTSIYTIDPEGSDITLVTDTTDDSYHPNWSANSQWIIFHMQMEPEEDGNRDLWMIRADGSDIVQLTETPFQERMPSWQPRILDGDVRS